VEKEVRALSILEANLRGTGVQVSSKDIRRLSDAAFRELAVIFADPPYEISQELWTCMAPRMRTWMGLGGILVWETDRRMELLKVEGWDLLHSRQYGAACFHFLQAT
jgi:16S rRNA G966 N2-methylase RsmD